MSHPMPAEWVPFDTFRFRREPIPIFVYGAGGHAKVVIDAIECGSRYTVDCILDDHPPAPHVLGYPVHEGWRDFVGVPDGIVAIGDNAARRRVSERLVERAMVVIDHPESCIARRVDIGPGSVILAGAVVNACVYLGRGVIINTAASVDHDCRIGDFAHIAPGAHLCGGVTVGEETLVGAGAIVTPGVKIGARCVIGAGSVITQDVPDGVTVRAPRSATVGGGVFV